MGGPDGVAFGAVRDSMKGSCSVGKFLVSKVHFAGCACLLVLGMVSSGANSVQNRLKEPVQFSSPGS